MLDSMEQSRAVYSSSAFPLASLRLLLVLRVISLKRLPRCWRTGMVPFVLIDYFLFLIFLSGVGNPRF